MRPSAPWRWETRCTFPPRSGYCFSSSWARSMLRSRHNLEPRHFNTSLRSGCNIECPWDRLHADHATTYASVLLDGTPRVGPFEGNTPVPESPRPCTGLAYQTSTSCPPVGGLSESRDRGHPRPRRRDGRIHDGLVPDTTRICTTSLSTQRLRDPNPSARTSTSLDTISTDGNTPGVNWRVRQDQKYLDPTPIDEFREKNRSYQLYHRQARKERGRRALGNDARRDPYQAPHWWTKPSVAPSKGKRRTLLPIPHSDPYIAMAFSIEQTGSDGNTKIRRGEDWRRSGHNATCTMHDQPFHHTPDHLVAVGLESLGDDPRRPLSVWGHDHDGAYRQ